MRRTAIALALLIAPLLALSGCTPTPPPAVTSPKPSSTPLFATEDEALKAATDAYAAYLKVSDQILAEGGTDPERLATVAVGEQLRADAAGFADAAAGGLRGAGSTTFDHVRVQQYQLEAPGAAIVYLCEDVSQVDVLNSQGASVVTASRPQRQAYEVTFDRASRVSNQLLVALKVARGSGSCNSE